MTDQPSGATHLDLDALADLLAGEGTAEQVDHVAACSGCAGRLDELAAAEVEVAAVLAALPVPPVPAGLADRLTATLAAEPALEPVPAAAELVAAPAAAAEHPAGRAGPATVTPFPTGVPPRRRTWLPAAAAVVLLAGGTLGGAALLSGGRGSSDQASDTAASAGGGESAADPLAGLAVSQTGTDYAAEGTLAGALPGLLPGGAGPAAAAPAQPAPVPESDEDFGSTGNLDLRAASPELDRLREPAALASCLAAVLPPEDDSVRPLALDYAAYGGAPALVVVLPALDAPDKIDVFVVGAGCALGNDETLFFTRLDRP